MVSIGVVLAVLWVAWAFFLFGGFLFGREWPDAKRRMPRGTRMASSLALAVAGGVVWAAARGGPWEALTAWTAVGMSLGFLGDLAMAQLLPLNNHVLGGILAFGLGHVAYIIGFWRASPSGPLGGIIAAWWLAGVALWYAVVWRTAQTRTILHRASLPYALLLATTAAMATSLSLQAPLFTIVAIGTALFLISDVLLAAGLFNGFHFRLIDDVIWLMYGPGQMLIVYGVALWALGAS